MKKPLSSEISKALTLCIGVAASLVSVSVFLVQFKSPEYSKIFTGISGGIIGGVFSYSIARIWTALNAPKLFISYSNVDIEFVEKLIKEIELYRVNILFDKHELNVGDNIHQKLNELVENCDYFLVVISENSNSSQWLQKEIELAVNSNKKVLPVIVDDATVPDLIRGLVYADFRDSFEKGVDQIGRALKNKKHNKPLHRTR